MKQKNTFDIYALELGPMDNFIHLIHDYKTNSAAVVDPAWDVPAIQKKAEEIGVTITDILLTHSHRDHINGVDELRAATGARLHLHEIEYEFWETKPEAPTLHKDNDKVRIGETEFTWLHTPGHTPGSSCFHFDGHLIAGDTLFVYGCGRCDMKGGDPKQMFEALKRLKHLPASTVIHPGHDYSVTKVSTMQEEATGNPFMQWPEAESFSHYRLVEHDRTRESPYAPLTKADLIASGLMSQ